MTTNMINYALHIIFKKELHYDLKSETGFPLMKQTISTIFNRLTLLALYLNGYRVEVIISKTVIQH